MSPVLDTDERFSRAFDAVGTFDYYCAPHPRMTGNVIVTYPHREIADG